MRPHLTPFAPRALAAAVWFLAALVALGVSASAVQVGWGEVSQYARGALHARVEGNTVRVAIPVAIESHWHLYHDDLGPQDAIGKPTVVTFEASGVEFGAVRFPEPKRYEQEGVAAGGKDTWIWGHEGEIVLYALGRIAEGGNFDPADLTAELSGLTCEDLTGTCVPYFEQLEFDGPGPDALFAAFPADLSTKPAPTTAATTPTVTPAAPRSDSDYDAVTFPAFQPRETLSGAGGAIERGLFVWLLLAFVAGAILNVMPCVLPVISIKVLSFVQQAGEDKRRVLRLGLTFAAGILVVFWALALMAIFAGQSWGQQFQSDGFLVAMIAVVFAFALSMFGVYELGVPAGVGSLAGMRREGLPDAFFKGMLATLLATPCSGPFLGSTLTWALKQPPLVIFLIFTALGLGMAVPYVILTAQPRLLKKLPKPGAWMDTFKQAMGFVLLATVVFLMVSLRTDLLLFTVTFLVFVALGCWWYGRFATFDKSSAGRFAHLGVALVLVAVGARLAFVEFRGAFQHESSGWVAFDPIEFQRHLDEGRPVFVDFTADWCVNCKVNEKFVFDSTEVRAAMAAKNVVAMKADVTDSNAYVRMVERFQAQLGSRSIPFLAVFDPRRPNEPLVKHALVSKDAMLEVFGSLADS